MSLPYCCQFVGRHCDCGRPSTSCSWKQCRLIGELFIS
eukprot:COSAG04_NODE_23166_length_343_cov_0.487705_2_plen_37_part_01